MWVPSAPGSPHRSNPAESFQIQLDAVIARLKHFDKIMKLKAQVDSPDGSPASMIPKSLQLRLLMQDASTADIDAAHSDHLYSICCPEFRNSGPHKLQSFCKPDLLYAICTQARDCDVVEVSIINKTQCSVL